MPRKLLKLEAEDETSDYKEECIKAEPTKDDYIECKSNSSSKMPFLSVNKKEPVDSKEDRYSDSGKKWKCSGRGGEHHSPPRSVKLVIRNDGVSFSSSLSVKVKKEKSPKPPKTEKNEKDHTSCVTVKKEPPDIKFSSIEIKQEPVSEENYAEWKTSLPPTCTSNVIKQEMLSSSSFHRFTASSGGIMVLTTGTTTITTTTTTTTTTVVTAAPVTTVATTANAVTTPIIPPTTPSASTVPVLLTPATVANSLVPVAGASSIATTTTTSAFQKNCDTSNNDLFMDEEDFLEGQLADQDRRNSYQSESQRTRIKSDTDILEESPPGDMLSSFHGLDFMVDFILPENPSTSSIKQELSSTDLGFDRHQSAVPQFSLGNSNSNSFALGNSHFSPKTYEPDPSATYSLEDFVSDDLLGNCHFPLQSTSNLVPEDLPLPTAASSELQNAVESIVDFDNTDSMAVSECSLDSLAHRTNLVLNSEDTVQSILSGSSTLHNAEPAPSPVIAASSSNSSTGATSSSGGGGNNATSNQQPQVIVVSSTASTDCIADIPDAYTDPKLKQQTESAVNSILGLTQEQTIPSSDFGIVDSPMDDYSNSSSHHSCNVGGVSTASSLTSGGASVDSSVACTAASTAMDTGVAVTVAAAATSSAAVSGVPQDFYSSVHDRSLDENSLVSATDTDMQIEDDLDAAVQSILM